MTQSICHFFLCDESLSHFLKQPDKMTVWNFGANALAWLAVQETAPLNISFCDPAYQLDAAADAIEEELLNIDTQLGVDSANNLSWLASLIADRNPYANDFQLMCARLKCIFDIVKSGGHHVFVFDTVQRSAPIAAALELNGINVLANDFCMTKVDSFSLWKITRAMLSALKMQWRYQAQMNKARRNNKKKLWKQLADCDVLLLDWAGENSFSCEYPTDQVGNMVRMAGLLRQQGLKVGFVANPLGWTQDYQKIAHNIAQAYDAVVSVDELRCLKDILLNAVIGFFQKIGWRSHMLVIGGLNVSPIWQSLCDFDLYKPQSTIFASYSSITRDLKRHAISPSALVYTFENQGWERALIFGRRQHLPETRLIGYQHAPFARRYIGFFSSQKINKSTNTPDKIILMGQKYKDWFLAHGGNPEQYQIGGSLRFESLHKMEPLRQLAGTKTVLCTAPMDYDDAVDIVVKTALAIKSLSDVRVIFNFHPIIEDSFRESIRSILENLLETERFELSTKRAADLFHECDVMVYNSSGTALDAMVVGFPTIYVAPSGMVNFDKLPDDLSRRAFTLEELRQFIHESLTAVEVCKPNPTISGFIDYVNEDAIIRAIRYD